MASRQEAVLSLVKFNKFFKDLTYNICISGNAQLITYIDELLNFEQWAYDVKEYATECADPIFFSKINMLGSPEMLENYLNDGKGIIPANNFDALFKVVNAVKELLRLVEEENEKARGEYANLVEEFAFENAASLFDRAVKAGYLTTEYQPKGDTSIHTLKILAFAIGEMLHLTMRHKWSHFEKLWNIDASNKLASLPISDKQFKRAAQLMALYPEVDFSSLIKPKDSAFFTPSYGSGKVRALYRSLLQNGYISKETTVDDFLSIFNLGKNTARTPVEWTSDQRHLSYFAFHTFSKTNKDFWIKTTACFLINGKAPHRGSMVSGLVALQANPNYDNYDPVLKKIASTYNNG